MEAASKPNRSRDDDHQRPQDTHFPNILRFVARQTRRLSPHRCWGMAKYCELYRLDVVIGALAALVAGARDGSRRAGDRVVQAVSTVFGSGRNIPNRTWQMAFPASGVL